MHTDWLTILEKRGEQGARQKFEEICATLFRKINTDKNVKSVKVSQGDGGIDIFIGDIGVEPVDVVQCKFFVNFGESQQTQIRNSFRTAIESTEYEMKSWTLCTSFEFTKEQHIWWSKWKKKKIAEHQLGNQFIQLKDGHQLVELLIEYDLYNHSFEKKDSLLIEKIHAYLFQLEKETDIKRIIQNASHSLFNIKNYIEKKSQTHLERSETQDIYRWINADLDNNQKNVLILKGEKGIGKSVILKDLYDLLIQNNFYVLGIKADKFYAENIPQLESKVFFDGFTFSQLLAKMRESNQKFIVIIDQIDALSQTLSSNRAYIQTYIRLITELASEKNVRIVVSTRSYDLDYDAELSIYNKNDFKKVTAKQFSPEEVKSVLRQFNVQTYSTKAIDLLRVPNHLEIFCKLPNRDKIQLDSILSLKDLYDALWKQTISPQKSLKLKALLFAVSKKMYAEQKITIKNIYYDDFYNELGYLSSNYLLIEQNNELSFFHQTFYEYCYARQFVENGNILEKCIAENGQSLYIRSIVKMVSEYLREYNIKSYIQSLSVITLSEDFRYHIKMLLIADFALIKSPSAAEKQFAIDNIITQKTNEELFFNSINSIGWINFLIDQEVLREYFQNLDFPQNCLHRLLYRNINHAPLKILEFVQTIKLTGQVELILNLLTNLEDWKEKGLLNFFTKFLSVEHINKHFWYNALEKISKYHLEFVFSELKPIIVSSYNGYSFDSKFEYSLNHILNELYENNRELTFEFLFAILQEIFENSKRLYLKYTPVESPLYGNSVIIEEYPDDNENGEDRSLIGYLIDFITASEDTWLYSFFEKYKNSNAVPILILISTGLAKKPSSYKNHSFELIQILNSKNAFQGSDDEFQLALRKLISVTYSSFDETQKKYIKSLLLSLKSSYDFFIYNNNDGKRKYSLKEFGKKKYLFIKALPISEVQNDIELKKTYQVLERKFGDINPNKSLHPSRSKSVAGMVGAPLSTKAYEKMSLTEWKKSMVKFNNTYTSDEFLKGGIVEHSRSFKDAVKNSPERFYEFLEKLFADGNIEINYLNAGIEGLIDANYDPLKVLSLFKQFIKFPLDRTYFLYACWMCDYFFKTQVADNDVVTFLSDVALKFHEKQKDSNPNSPLVDSVNSVRGAAVHYLMYGVYNSQFKEIIFSTLENVINHPLCNVSVKADLVYNLAFLNRLDLNRAFATFLGLTNSGEKTILEYSLHSAQYFNNTFHTKMDAYFDLVLSHPDIHKKAFVFVSSWLNDSINDRVLYEKFVATGSIAKECALTVAEANLIKNGAINQKALSILVEFINEENEEIVREYAGIILRKFKEQNFYELLPFLRCYASSKACSIEPNYFLKYLILCSKGYPVECLELLSEMDFSIPPDIRYRGYYTKEPIQLVLGIYSKLVSEINKNEVLIGRCLDVFDGLLKNPHLRNNANEAIEMIL